MPSIEFEVWCKCGSGLYHQCKEEKGGIIVEPCESCLNFAYDDGFSDGHEQGYDEGYNDAKDDI